MALAPDYLLGAADDIVELYAKLEQEIMKDIARRIAKAGRVTATAEWQIYRAQEMGTLYSDIIAEVAKINKQSYQELDTLFNDAAVKSHRYDSLIYRAAGLSPLPINQSLPMLQVLMAGLEKTGGVMHNLTRTTALAAQQQYINATDLVYMQITSGAFDYNTAIANGIRQAAEQGAYIYYASGHRDRLDVAIRRAALTGVNQTCARISERNAEEMGVDLVETTAHAGARPDHAIWQGRIFSLSGKSRQYPALSAPMEKGGAGYGDVAGLCGANCRHSFFPFFPDSPRAYSDAQLEHYDRQRVNYNGQSMSLYDATQLQRHQEREIRRWKREELMLDEVGQDSSFAAAKVKQWQARQRDLIRQTGLRRESARERIISGAAKAGQGTVPLAAKATGASYSAGRAASISEATNYAKVHAHTVDFRGIRNLQSLNEMNGALDYLRAKYPSAMLDELNSSRATSFWANANFRSMSFTSRFMNDPVGTTASATVDWRKLNEEARDSYIAAIESQKKALLTETDYWARRFLQQDIQRDQNALNAIYRQLRYDRHNVVYAGQEVRSVTIHEYAHTLADQLFGFSNGTYANSAYSADPNNPLFKKAELVRSTFDRAKREGDLLNISMYSAKNAKEFLSEAFVIYELGLESLPGYIVKMIEEVFAP